MLQPSNPSHLLRPLPLFALEAVRTKVVEIVTGSCYCHCGARLAIKTLLAATVLLAEVVFVLWKGIVRVDRHALEARCACFGLIVDVPKSEPG